jgi:hypothetical protein
MDDLDRIGGRGMDDDLSTMGDPEFLALRRQVREELERTPEHELSRELGLDPASFLAVTKPYAERRTLATARRRWPHGTAPGARSTWAPERERTRSGWRSSAMPSMRST